MVGDYFSKMFILHLPRTVKRRALVLCQTAFLGSEHVEVVPAVDGRMLDLEDMKARGILKRDDHLQRDLTPGEVGCYLGHVTIWRSLLKLNLNHALICEDDLVWRTDANEIVDAFMTEVPEDWDIIHFHNSIRVGSGKYNDPGRRQIGRHVWRGYNEGRGSACYALKARGAQFLLDMAFPIQSTVDGKTNWLTGWWKACRGYTGYVCWPFPCEVAQVDSEIDTIEERPEVRRSLENMESRACPGKNFIKDNKQRNKR
jgi:glycosyl transferase family 25